VQCLSLGQKDKSPGATRALKNRVALPGPFTGLKSRSATVWVQSCPHWITSRQSDRRTHASRLGDSKLTGQIRKTPPIVCLLTGYAYLLANHPGPDVDADEFFGQ